mmetsp:Transcript_5834/g.11561  ORF Transcript_5834/g.11561 Transcript_5834/m.11561 type:complete len:111 (+) Transcript_5834:2-334(+)
MNWLKTSEAFAYAAHIPCRELQQNGSQWLEELARTFKLKHRSADLQTTVKCQLVGSHCQDTPYTRPETPEWVKEFSPQLLNVVNAWLDPKIEAAFGYALHPSLEAAAKGG